MGLRDDVPERTRAPVDGESERVVPAITTELPPILRVSGTPVDAGSLTTIVPGRDGSKLTILDPIVVNGVPEGAFIGLLLFDCPGLFGKGGEPGCEGRLGCGLSLETAGVFGGLIGEFGFDGSELSGGGGGGGVGAVGRVMVDSQGTSVVEVGGLIGGSTVGVGLGVFVGVTMGSPELPGDGGIVDVGPGLVVGMTGSFAVPRAIGGSTTPLNINSSNLV